MKGGPHSYAEFWPYYLGEHRRPATRRLHLLYSDIRMLALFATGRLGAELRRHGLR